MTRNRLHGPGYARLFGDGVLPPSHLNVLFAVCKLYDGVTGVKLRDLRRELGVHLNHIVQVLNVLRRKGLVTWEYDRRGTLRPCCRVTFFEGGGR